MISLTNINRLLHCRLSLCLSSSPWTIHAFPKRFASFTSQTQNDRAAKNGLCCGGSLLLPRRCCRISCTDSDSNSEALIEEEEECFFVVNFYEFVFVEDPFAEVSKHLSFMEGLDIHGRIYINEQGINAQYSGPSKDAMVYVEWLKEDKRFSGILVQISPAKNGHAFPKLKLRYKPSLVQFEGGIADLPLLDPTMRATPLAPSEWKKRLETANTTDKLPNKDARANCILLDVRNGYEWDIGHFEGARRPDVDSFRTTSFGLSDSELEATASDPLADVDKQNTDILMYCTGGIRCDVYSTILRQRGFQNLYTLEGGVSNYLKNEGPINWTGNLFVFDSRLSLPPSTYNAKAIKNQEVPSKNNGYARCYICDSQVRELKHRNCANLDCNLLFLCCADCVTGLRGCCSMSCTNAPRVRPVLPGHQRYQKWHIYRDSELPSKLAAQTTLSKSYR